MGHEAGYLFLGFDWTAVTVAIIAAIGSILSACASVFAVALLWTPSRTRIGKQVEDAQNVGLANHYKLRQIEAHLGFDEKDVA